LYLVNADNIQMIEVISKCIGNAITCVRYNRISL